MAWQSDGEESLTDFQARDLSPRFVRAASPPNNSFQRTNGLRPFAAELMIRYAVVAVEISID